LEGETLSHVSNRPDAIPFEFKRPVVVIERSLRGFGKHGKIAGHGIVGDEKGGKRLFEGLHELLCFLRGRLFIHNLLAFKLLPDQGFDRLPVPVVEILKGEIA
jgi:hypothetical protein